MTILTDAIVAKRPSHIHREIQTKGAPRKLRLLWFTKSIRGKLLFPFQQVWRYRYSELYADYRVGAEPGLGMWRSYFYMTDEEYIMHKIES